MKYNSKMTWHLCVVYIFFFGYVSLATEDHQTVGQKKRDSIIEGLKKKQIHVYGKVLDQMNNPVSDAEVMIHWERFSTKTVPMQKRWLKADENGNWDFKTEAVYLNVWEAKKGGYIFSRAQQDGSLNSDDIDNNLTSPANRFVLRLHKLIDPTFLVNQEGRLARATTEIPIAISFDIFREKIMPTSATNNRSNNEFYSDLEIRVEKRDVGDSWRVSYRALGDNGGLIVTNALLFEAPSMGYAQDCVLVGKRDKDFPRYLYLRSRTPAVYTRFNIHYSLRPDSCVLSYELWSNPYGSRSLEYDENLKSLWRLREKLTKEARSEFGKGKRPPKPNIKALIKAEKEKKK